MEHWLNDASAGTYGQRKSRGTRLPLYRDWRDLRFLAFLIVIVSLPLVGVKEVVGGSVAAGTAALVAGVIGVALLVRYLRMPVDPDERRA